MFMRPRGLSKIGSITFIEVVDCADYEWEDELRE